MVSKNHLLLYPNHTRPAPSTIPEKIPPNKSNAIVEHLSSFAIAAVVEIAPELHRAIVNWNSPAAKFPIQEAYVIELRSNFRRTSLADATERAQRFPNAIHEASVGVAGES